MKATSTKPFAPRQYDFKAEDLRQMRHVERLSLEKIDWAYGCHHTTVLYAFRRLGVPHRLDLIGPSKHLQGSSAPSVPNESVTP